VYSNLSRTSHCEAAEGFCGLDIGWSIRADSNLLKPVSGRQQKSY
jgi:hypothetical protein